MLGQTALVPNPEPCQRELPQDPTPARQQPRAGVGGAVPLVTREVAQMSARVCQALITWLCLELAHRNSTNICDKI